MTFDATQQADGVVFLLALEVQVCRAIKAVTCNKPIAKILDIYNNKKW
jgi:tRNA threonylcarbamoyladenosine modification (KEOPS) complex Cgi121 subunit